MEHGNWYVERLFCGALVSARRACMWCKGYPVYFICLGMQIERRAASRVGVCTSVHAVATRVPYRDTESRAEGAQRAARGHRVLIGQGALEIEVNGKAVRLSSRQEGGETERESRSLAGGC